VETGSAAHLAGILLKNDEAQIASTLGLTRIAALLGKKYRFYPVPTWSDLDREPVASLKSMDSSLLGKIARTGVRASYYEEHHRILLSLFPSSQTRLRKFLGDVPPSNPVALLTQPDLHANACMVWAPGSQHPAAITPEGSNGSRKSGAFVAFLPDQKATEIRMFEDGFFVFLTNDEWKKVRDSLLSDSQPYSTPQGTDGAVSIQWVKPEAYTSPVTGDTVVAERWVEYKPDSTAPKRTTKAISDSRIVLLSSESDLPARTTVQELADYVKAIETKIDVFFVSEDSQIRRELTIHIALTSTGHQLGLVASPELKTGTSSDLTKLLESVPAPKTKGPVEFDDILTLWDPSPN
jgi:hypothetical protein